MSMFFFDLQSPLFLFKLLQHGSLLLICALPDGFALLTTRRRISNGSAVGEAVFSETIDFETSGYA